MAWKLSQVGRLRPTACGCTLREKESLSLLLCLFCHSTFVSPISLLSEFVTQSVIQLDFVCLCLRVEKSRLYVLNSLGQFFSDLQEGKSIGKKHRETTNTIAQSSIFLTSKMFSDQLFKSQWNSNLNSSSQIILIAPHFPFAIYLPLLHSDTLLTSLSPCCCALTFLTQYSVQYKPPDTSGL